MGKARQFRDEGRMSGGNMGRGGNVRMARTVNRPAPGRQVSLSGGGTANIRPNGQIRSINRNGMHIDHGLNGSRRIESTHNGARIVTTGRNSGYVQRAYVTRNGTHLCVADCRRQSRDLHTRVSLLSVSRPLLLRLPPRATTTGPRITVGPTIRGQRRFITDGAGAAHPGMDITAGISPVSVYPSAAFWLTDYLIAANLQAAYEAQAAANAAAANAAASNAGRHEQCSARQQQSNGGNDARQQTPGPLLSLPRSRQRLRKK